MDFRAMKMSLFIIGLWLQLLAQFGECGFSDSRFINFQKDNNTVIVKMKFDIPFFKIPVQRSINGVYDMMKLPSLTQMNLGAVAMAAIIAFSAVLVNQAAATQDAQFINYRTLSPADFWNYKKNVCNMVQQSMLNLKRNKFNKFDVILDDLTTSKWSMDLINDNTIRDSIVAARNLENCNKI